MLVYRVEHSEKEHGPYSRKSRAWAFEGQSELPIFPNEDHPEPFRDFDYVERSEFKKMHRHQCLLYGFPSLHALKKWFDPKQRETLRKAGFRVVEYLVSDENVLLSKSKKQLLFATSERRLKKIPK